MDVINSARNGVRFAGAVNHVNRSCHYSARGASFSSSLFPRPLDRFSPLWPVPKTRLQKVSALVGPVDRWIPATKNESRFYVHSRGQLERQPRNREVVQLKPSRRFTAYRDGTCSTIWPEKRDKLLYLHDRVPVIYSGHVAANGSGAERDRRGGCNS